MNFIKLNTEDQKMMDMLYSHYQAYEAEITSSEIEEIFPYHLENENYLYFENYFKRGITTYLYFENNKILGFVGYHIDSKKVKGYAEGYDGWGHLAEIYTIKECRGRDIGKVMVKKVEDELIYLGVTSIYLTDLSDHPSFWKSLEYIDTLKIEPNEGGRIFEKYLVHQK